MVKVWKVILAACVIFAAGLVTGALTMHLRTPVPAPAIGPVGFGPFRQRGEFLDRMQRQLYLTPVQRQHIEQILRENHERMKLYWDSIAPQAQEQHRQVQERIRAELTPEQQKRFEEMLRRGPNRNTEEHRRREDHRDPKPVRRSEAPASPAGSTNQTGGIQ